MRKVYTHQNSLIVGNARNILQDAGIEVVMRNQYAAGALGETAPQETWPEVWVARDRDYERACAILDASMSAPGEQDWVCRACGERNGAAFELCWNCAAPFTAPVPDAGR